MEQGDAVTVNGDHYRAMLNEFLFTKIEDYDLGNIWFQQDGDTCNTAEATLDVLRPFFEDHKTAELMSFGHLGAAILHPWIALSAAELMAYGHLGVGI